MDRDLKIRVILTKLGDLVGPLKAIGNQSRATTEGLRATQAQLKSLQQTQNNIASFRQLKTQLAGTSTEMTAAQARVDALATAFNAAEKPTKKLSAEFSNAKKFAAALKTQHAEQAAALQALRDKLSAAGVSTRDLVAGERTLRGDLAKTTAQLDAQKKALGNLAQADRRRAANQRQLDQSRTRASNIAVGGAATLGTGLAILAPVQAAIGAASQFQGTMTSIAQKTGLSRIEATKLGQALASLGPRVNQLPSDLAAGADALAGLGLAAQNIPTLLLPIGRAATAYEARIEDLSNASFAVVDNLKVPFEQSARAIDIMAAAGKRGAFELKDMAQFFPALTAAAQGLGQTGAPAVADLAAALQIARKGAGDASSAAGNLQNLLAKISSPGTVKAFAKMGVDLPKALEKLYAEGKTPIEAIAELTNKTLGGDLSRLGNLFEDMQVQQALRPLIGNLALYRQIRSDALKASGTVEADYAQRLLDAGQGTKALEVVTQSLQVKLGTVLIPTMVKLALIATNVLDRMIKWADANPRLAQVIAITAAALGVILVVAGGLAIALAGVLGPFAMMRYAMVTMAPAAWALATSLWAAAAPILPFIAAAAGLIAIAVAIYNHWGKLVAVFSGLGGRIIDGLVVGFENAKTRLLSKFTGLANKVASTFKNALGIRSPSRVFAGYGGHLMTGLANGIDGGADGPVQRIGKLSKQLTASLAIGAATLPAAASALPAPVTAAPPAPLSARPEIRNPDGPVARIAELSRQMTAALAIGEATARPAAAGADGNGRQGTAPAAAAQVVQYVEINIPAAPGQSPTDIAKAVEAALTKAANAKAAARRSSLGDYGE